jgi:hypothetical protein
MISTLFKTTESLMKTKRETTSVGTTKRSLTTAGILMIKTMAIIIGMRDQKTGVINISSRRETGMMIHIGRRVPWRVVNGSSKRIRMSVSVIGINNLMINKVIIILRTIGLSREIGMIIAGIMAVTGVQNKIWTTDKLMIRTIIIGRLESPTITTTGIDLTIRTLGKAVTITVVIDVMSSVMEEPIEEMVTTKAIKKIGNRISKTSQRMTEPTSEKIKARKGTTRMVEIIVKIIRIGIAETAAIGSSMLVMVTNAREIVKIGIMTILKATIIEMKIEMRTKGIREEGVEAPTTSTITGIRSVISKKWARIETEGTMVHKACREIPESI